MPEVRTELRTFQVDCTCEACGLGRMRSTGAAYYMTWPPKYPHRCGACGAEKVFDQTYPRIEYATAESKP